MIETLSMMPVEVSFKPSGKYWLASCPSLDIHTQGEDFERAQENLKEALMLFIESCLSRGTLEEVLGQAGYSPVQIRKVEHAARKDLPFVSSLAECRA
jgi:predicted RNase H-like HicB family nuclease